MDTGPRGDDRRLLTAAEHLLGQVAALTGPSGKDVVDDLRRVLQRPPVVALAGRVNTGKSTLVNSLIGARLAPTSAEETTALLSLYMYGAPARAEALLERGQAVDIPLSASGPSLGSISLDTVNYLLVFLQSAVLRRFAILDTPGLGSAATANSRRTEVDLLAGSTTAASPDVLVYVVKDKFRPDDEEFVRSFISSRRSSMPSPPVIGALSHADKFGAGPWGATDPVEEARATASALAAAHSQLTAVVPVSGLLAETVRTGRLQEADVRALRVLKDVPNDSIQFADILGLPEGISRGQYQRLEDLIGAYGIMFGRNHSHSSPELVHWLWERSGLARLEEALTVAVSGAAERSRVLTVLSGLARAARSRSWSSDTRKLIEAARHAPEFHRLNESAALDVLRQAAPQHGLVAVLEELIADKNWPTALTPDEDEPAEYLRLAAHYQAMAASASTGAEAQAARVLCRSLLIHSRLEG
ncbi:hypothetical protein FDW83_11260 [Pseudarthrobacter sp. NamE2]|uniref:GTPase n=1 Tax=Pseudarthrobacter sp. NamE2 TaxID=2576838 RepID=UPI0010FEA5E7|nr:GTPase [Pseudarthrobacter sp. NamE2]TLM82968.1 hypothetical protein FDW83_11260 [Pseudarthrobacter sp. NamE2]